MTDNIQSSPTGQNSPASQNSPAGLHLWLAGMRPRTLTIAASPVIVGSALAFHQQGEINWLIALITLLCAFAIQAGTNFFNDAADGERGHDTPTRTGPARLTAQGWASAADVKRAALACFAIAGFGGLYLVNIGGCPILLIGILSIASGYAYSTGPVPLSHTPLGEVFVIVFFGLIAVTGTTYLQTGIVSTIAGLSGIAIGLFGAAVLMVNNSRDRLEDKQAGRRTLAIIAGTKTSQLIYGFLVAAPFVIQLTNELALSASGNWLPLLPMPFALFLIWRFKQAKTGSDFNMLLIQTAKLQFAFAVLLALGLVALTLETATQKTVTQGAVMTGARS